VRKQFLTSLSFLVGTALLISGCRSQPNVPRTEKEETVAEAVVRQRIEDWAKAVGAKDIEAVLALYAPDNISFDLDPPLRYSGAENKRRAWREFFTVYAGPLTYELREVNVTAQGELAFAHSLNHVRGMLANGHTMDLWVRWTACFRRINGVWLVVHDHVSVPADLAHGQAVLNLTPEEDNRHERH
jgi:ketosteroid isomerase-like protein